MIYSTAVFMQLQIFLFPLGAGFFCGLQQPWNKVFPTLKNVMGDPLASITISGGGVALGAAMVELRSIIPCDSHLPPHCSDPLSDQWAGCCWIAFRMEVLSDRAERDRNNWISALF